MRKSKVLQIWAQGHHKTFHGYKKPLEYPLMIWMLFVSFLKNAKAFFQIERKILKTRNEVSWKQKDRGECLNFELSLDAHWLRLFLGNWKK